MALLHLIPAVVVLVGVASFAVTASPPVEGATPAGEATGASPLRVMSFNVRFDNANDGEHAWPRRRPRAREVLRFYRPDVLRLQEALAHQVEQVADDLPGYAWVGVGRNDGKAAGEFAPIFYKANRLDLLDSGTFWLSPTPNEVGSKGWDAALPRIATWARLHDREGEGGEFVAINTHFDHRGQIARTESAKLIVRRAAEIAGDLPIVLTGDFNATPDSDPYRVLADAYADARATAETTLGPAGTFGTFTAIGAAAPQIDYIFVPHGTAVTRFATLAHHWQGHHVSDHFPVMADVRLSEGEQQPGTR